MHDCLRWGCSDAINDSLRSNQNWHKALHSSTVSSK